MHTDHVLYSCNNESAQIWALSRNVGDTNLVYQLVLLLGGKVVFHIFILNRWLHFLFSGVLEIDRALVKVLKHRDELEISGVRSGKAFF